MSTKPSNQKTTSDLIDILFDSKDDEAQKAAGRELLKRLARALETIAATGGLK